MNTKAPITAPELNFDTPALRRNRSLRALKDRVTTICVGIGGMGVIMTIMLIFVYLMYEVFPLFKGADVSPWSDTEITYQVGSSAPTLHLSMEEQNEVGFRLAADGSVTFFDIDDGDVRLTDEIVLPAGDQVSAFAIDSDVSRIFAVASDQGNVALAKPTYDISYPQDKRLITPSLVYPYGEETIELASGFGKPVVLAIRDEEESSMIVAANVQQQLTMVKLEKTENFLTGEVQLEAETFDLPLMTSMPFKILISPDLRWVYVFDQAANLSILDVRYAGEPELHSVHKVSDVNLTDVAFLLGGNTLTIADESGLISQWFMVRDDSNQYELTKIREFAQQGSANVLAMEHRRRGVVSADASGNLAFYSASAGVQVYSEKLIDEGIDFVAMSPRASAMLIETASGKLIPWQVSNKHPDTSWVALWNKIWYEGYQAPEYIWQSSAANNDFEPKYSLMPLAFGTLKAAFYAMLMATPLAICGAIYTAYFMAPAMRRKVKPLIELMEALPTVILGFLAGLWLAPFVETNLASIFTLLMVVPLGVLVFAYLWSQLPRDSRWQLPEGWNVALIIPVVAILAWVAIPLGEVVEAQAFDGNMRNWISEDLGINFDQRNALVVGLAMGFAVIPTIFSITEDAIFSVPKHLSQGSLALGATPWQTLTRVVMPTASPGIFSAVMIGMGRAVGETMIVLMATGNTPIMDMNIFEGMRTLAANIAVEMPESEVGSSHFRILFLAALVLFSFTFMVNTLAEIIRQRLRKKYGSL